MIHPTSELVCMLAFEALRESGWVSAELVSIVDVGAPLRLDSESLSSAKERTDFERILDSTSLLKLIS